MSGFKAAVFDMDGTILNTLLDLQGSVNHCLALYGYPPVGEKEVAAALGNGAGHLVEALIPGGKADPHYEDVLNAHIPYYEEHCDILTGPYEGIIDAMELLGEGGVHMAIVSNKGDGAVQELSARYFKGIVKTAVGEKAGIRRKPAPDTVFEALRRLDVSPGEAVFVGDTEVDLETARNAGMSCILVSWGFRSRDTLEKLGAEYLVDSAGEMADIILGRQRKTSHKN